MKRILSLILSVVLILSCISTEIFASGGNIVTAIVPENIDIPETVTSVFEDFEDSSYEFASNVIGKDAVFTTQSGNGGEVLDVNSSSASSLSTNYVGAADSGTITVPPTSLGYTISFDIKHIDSIDGDMLWVMAFSGTTAADKTAFQLPLTMFDKGYWYNLKVDVKGDGISAPALNATLTNKDNGDVTNPKLSVSGSWSGQQNKLRINTYNKSLPAVTDKARNPWKAHYQLDNISLSYEVAKSITTTLSAAGYSGNAVPLLAAYDKNDVLTSVKFADTKYVTNTASTEFDIMPEMSEFKNAKSVKAIYIDDFHNVKALGTYAEIGDLIDTSVSEGAVDFGSISVTSDMLPPGGTGNFTCLAYTVPFTVRDTDIPVFNPDEHDLLALDQNAAAFGEIRYGKSLYDSEKEDIVLIINADGAANAEITLIEKNTPSSFENINLQLGADESQVNLTWFSLDKSQGYVSYIPKARLVNGDIPANAPMVAASRNHADTEYSQKEYYYNNKATLTDLIPDTEYVYQLTNGRDKSDLISFRTGKGDGSFSFAFVGDPQVGRTSSAEFESGSDDFSSLEADGEAWMRTLNQITNDSHFEGVEFLVNGGDHINSTDYANAEKLNEAQYDCYFQNPLSSLPQINTYGNHDYKTAVQHAQHFNDPNLSSYGVSRTDDGDVMNADFYAVYDSVLFIVLNGNTFKNSSTYSEAVSAENKRASDDHIAFIDSVLKDTSDNKDIMWRIVLIHQSPYGSSYHGNYKYDSSDNTFSRSEQQAYIDMRTYLYPHFYEIGVDMVLSGHDHCYTRSHIIKPVKDSDGIYIDPASPVTINRLGADAANDLLLSSIPAYSDGSYKYKDGTNIPSFTNWTDANGFTFDNLKVSKVPVSVTDPDGVLYVTGGTSTGCQVNGVEYNNHYAAVTSKPNTRQASKIEITPNTLTLKTYNLGNDTVDSISEIDSFTITKTGEITAKAIQTQDSITLPLGDSKVLNTSVSPSGATGYTLSFASSNPSVAAVDAVTGVITASSVGETSVTVSCTSGDEIYTDTCIVNVIDKVMVSDINLSDEAITINMAEVKTLQVSILPENATDKNLIWTSSNPDVASVNEYGNVTGLSEGTSTVTAYANDGGGRSASCVVTVRAVPATVRQLSESELAMKVLGEDKLTATILPENASYRTVTWYSSDDSIVSVDENGNLRAFKQGDAVIYADTGEDEPMECLVTVVGGVLFSQDNENKDVLGMLPGSSSMNAAGDGWTLKEDSDGNNILNLDCSVMADSAFTMSGGNTNRATGFTSKSNIIPIPESDFIIEYKFRKLGDGYTDINFIAYDHNNTPVKMGVDISELESETWYNIRMIYSSDKKCSAKYKLADASEWIDMPISGGYNPSSGYNRLSIFPMSYDGVSLDKAKNTHWQFDDIAVLSPIRESAFIKEKDSGDESLRRFTVYGSNITDEATVYFAAYNDDKELIGLERQPYSEYGNVFAYPKAGEAKSFKAFIWGSGMTPYISALKK